MELNYQNEQRDHSGEIQSNITATDPVGHTPLHKHALRVRGSQGRQPQGGKSLRAKLTFLVKFFSDFTEFPIAKRKQKKRQQKLPFLYVLPITVLLCLFVSAHVCMHVWMGVKACICVEESKREKIFSGLLTDIKGHLAKDRGNTERRTKEDLLGSTRRGMVQQNKGQVRKTKITGERKHACDLCKMRVPGVEKQDCLFIPSSLRVSSLPPLYPHCLSLCVRQSCSFFPTQPLLHLTNYC